MKYICILLLGLSFNSFAQNGALNLLVLDNPSLKPLVVCAYLQSDSTEQFVGCTDENGNLRINKILAGRRSIRLEGPGKDFGTRDFFVQDRQMLSTTILIDTFFQGMSINQQGNYELGMGGELRNAVPLIDPNLPYVAIKNHDGVQHLACVTISVYQNQHRLTNVGTSGTTISRKDVRNMPLRSAVNMATTVPGVQTFGDNNELHIRGSRSDANIFYLDGFRVNSVNDIPKAFMNEVQVYTGGIPANYGDVTGGIISVESPGYFDLYRDWKSEQLRNGYGYSYDSEEDEVDAEPVEPRISADRFHPIYENMFLSPKDHPNSTFGLDVDRASWTYVQNCFDGGQEIHRDAVKMEEMINSFRYREIDVPENELLHVEIVRSECMWNENNELLSVHLKAMDLPENIQRKAHNFVFLIDVSGSMNYGNKLPLLKRGLADFVKSLRPDDVVSIVTYAGHVGVALEPTSDKTKVLNALSNLQSGGSTNGMGGVQKAYELAEANLDLEKNNRIILCTDGDFNVGISDPKALENYIAEKRGKGVYLTALGFGMGNYRNDILESLADRGDGNHFYINSLQESQRVLVEEVGNLLNIARDVKLDVAFDSTLVQWYRLIGYENRLLQPEDFEDDTKDGGEIGYGHEVVAVYEIERAHDSTLVRRNDAIAEVRLRYKPFEEQSSIERSYSVYSKDKIERSRKLNSVVGFGLLLRNSVFSNLLTASDLREYSNKMTPENDDDHKLLKMIDSFEKQQFGL